MEENKRKYIIDNLEILREKNKKNFSKCPKIFMNLDLFIPGFFIGIIMHRVGKIYFTIEPLYASINLYNNRTLEWNILRDYNWINLALLRITFANHIELEKTFVY